MNIIHYICANKSRIMKAIFLANKLRGLREQHGFPQCKISAALDIDTATYCKMENGNYIP